MAHGSTAILWLPSGSALFGPDPSAPIHLIYLQSFSPVRVWATGIFPRQPFGRRGYIPWLQSPCRLFLLQCSAHWSGSIRASGEWHPLFFSLPGAPESCNVHGYLMLSAPVAG